MDGIIIDSYSLKNPANRVEIAALLASAELGLDADIDYTVAAHEDGRLVGTCSKAQNIIKCLTVVPEHRGEGLSGRLVEAVMDRLFEEGRAHFFVYTCPNNTCLFKSLGFKLLGSGAGAALLEGGLGGIETRLREMKADQNLSSRNDRGALVMNCNPFTLGHQHLIAHAAASCPEVLVFVVEADRSVFGFDDRLEMVRQGTAHLPNVRVLPGSEYIISSATFPSYFLREEDDRALGYMELDAKLFCRWFAPAFGITARFVGEEPYCGMTLSYNRTLERVLIEAGLKLTEIPRLEVAGEPVSASRVRQLLRDGRDSEAQALVPASTWHYLTETPSGKEAVARVRRTLSSH